MTYIFFGEKTSMRALVCCGIIILGFILGIDQENGLGNSDLVFRVVFIYYLIMFIVFLKRKPHFTRSSVRRNGERICRSQRHLHQEVAASGREQHLETHHVQ
jgi:hypothetical protein